MKTQTATFIYKCLRTIEITSVFLCFLLEIIEYASFEEFYNSQGLPSSAYFSTGITTSSNGVTYANGIKIYYYIVLLTTLVDSVVYVTRCRRNNTNPFKRDISINAFFAALWITSGLANISPVFHGYSFTCNDLNAVDPSTSNALARECHSKVLSISLGWINGCLFFVTTLIALKLWRERQERYEGERRVEALGEVVYKYKPRPNTIVRVDEPEQVMIYKTINKSEKKRGTPTYLIRTSHVPN